MRFGIGLGVDLYVSDKAFEDGMSNWNSRVFHKEALTNYEIYMVRNL